MIFPARNLHLWLGFSMAMLVIARWYIICFKRFGRKGIYAGDSSWQLEQSGFDASTCHGVKGWWDILGQWEFQEPMPIGGTYCRKKTYNIRPKFQGISPENMAWTMVTYLHFRILKIPHWFYLKVMGMILGLFLFEDTIWLWLTVCHGKIHPCIFKFGKPR